MLLLLSGDISRNPGPINGSQQHNYDQWAVFKKRGLHFAHIDFNINLFSKQKCIFHQTNTQSMSPEVKSYFQFCSLYGLKQLIKSPTRVTCSTSSLIDHILTTFPERVSQQGIIDVGLSDHQLIYCTRKFSRTKLGTHKQIKFRSLKNYTAEAYKEALGKVCFPDYENFNDVIKLLKTSIKN